MKPLFPYYGGKGRIAPWIAAMKPPPGPGRLVDCEPFCGSGAVLYASEPAKVEVLNDHDESLINCFRIWARATSRRKLLRLLQCTLYSRAEYKRAEKILNSGFGRGNFHATVNQDMIDEAWAFMVMVSMSHGSQPMGAGLSIDKSGSNPPSKPWANGRATGFGFSKDGTRTHAGSWSIQRGTAGSGKDLQWSRKSWEARAKRIERVTLECDDALKVIKRWDGENTFFYNDSPYPGTNQGHYKGYTLEDFKEQVELMDSIEGSFLLSNYDQPITMPDHWERFEKEVYLMAAKRKGAKRGTRTEIVWRHLNEIATGAVRKSQEQRELFA